jgi:hypothetical protein
MKNSRSKLVLIVLISLFPIISGWFLYHYHEHFHFKTMNHGTLINPPFQVQDLILQNNNKKQWQIVYIPNNCCDAECQKITYTLHQLRLVLAKDADRVSLGVVLNKMCAKQDTHDFRKIDFTQQQYKNLENTFLQHAAENAKTMSEQSKIYLLDPIGNIFMYYPASTDAMNILKDMKRVLEVSQIG